MSMTRELTCIRCPLGCQLMVTKDRESIKVSGNTCPRGAEYGAKEIMNPTRIVTSSVKVIGGDSPLVSVKTSSDIPKDKIFDVMSEIHKKIVEAPINIGDCIIGNVAETGADIVATSNIFKLQKY